MKFMLRCSIALLMFGLLLSGKLMSAPLTCNAPEQLMAWPAVNPIWELCYLPPNQSVGPQGSGLELRNVQLHGRLVLKKAHAPMLLAEYTTSTCYRDWMDTPVPLLAEPAVRNQLGVSSAFNATTSCDRSDQPVQSFGSCPFQLPGRNGADCFLGVAIEDRGDYVVMTTQYNAAWYYYSSRFYFYADGSFSPEFGFGNNNGTNNGITHWHHNYWRLDFDIEGAENDVISQNGVVQSTEFASLRCNAATSPSCVTERNWTVLDTTTGRGFQLLPGSDDYITPANQSGRGFHLVDVIGTRYIAGEYNDNPNYDINDCGVESATLANGGDLDGDAGAGTDVVLYYRVGVRDRTNEGPNTQDSMICKKAGPIFAPIGSWQAEFENGFE